MPPTKTPKGHAKGARAEPYSASKPAQEPVPAAEKENESPKPTASPPNKSNNATEHNTNEDAPTTDRSTNYLDIPLEEKDGEVPCYENASAIRRKLNALLDKKTPIPDTSKPLNKTNLSAELQKIAQSHHPIESTAGTRNAGPNVRALTTFLKKSGAMGGGDSETYYHENMLVEKMRIWEGGKKGKVREKAEVEFPNGRLRVDPDHFSILCRPEERPTKSEVANMKR